MSSEDCKRYLKNITIEKAWPQDVKWKRLSKSKNGNVTLRIFENQYGEKVTVSEDNNIYALLKENGAIESQKVDLLELPEAFKKTLTKEKLFRGIINEALGSSYKEDIMDNAFAKGLEHIVKNFIKTGDDKVLTNHLTKYDYALNNDDSEDDNLSRILYYMHDAAFKSTIDSGNVGIDYDTENIMAYFWQKEGIEYIKLVMGGDWEMPVYAILYWSEKDKQVKGFFPLDKGNTYNIKEKTAYGSETSSGISIKKVKYDTPEYEVLETQFEKEREYYEKNYDKMNKKAEIEGFKQFKKHLLNTEV